MSFVNATPEYVASAASDLAKIGSSISYANSTASTVTSAVEAAGADAVSTSISQLFGAHAAAYQAISSQAALFHQQFVQLMSGGATEYADTEAVNAAPLQAGAQPVLGGAGPSAAALSAQQPLIGSAAQAGSVASGVPVAAAVQPGAAAPAAVAATAAARQRRQLLRWQRPLRWRPRQRDRRPRPRRARRRSHKLRLLHR